MIRVFGKQFHKECFTCVECGRVLNSKEDDYFEIDGFGCCSEHKQVECAACGNLDAPDVLFTAFGQQWHPDCFVCSEPGCIRPWDLSKIEETVEIRQGKPVCKFHQLEICCKCKQTVQEKQGLFIDDRHWH